MPVRRRLLGALPAAALAALTMVLAGAAVAGPPEPMVAKGNPVEWWFVYKFNSYEFKKDRPFVKCGADSGIRACPFDPKTGKKKGKVATEFGSNVSQQYVFAFHRKGAQSRPEDSELAKGKGCLGMTMTDPVGATFDQIYHGSLNYLVWNDQFYDDPPIAGCSKGKCDLPWGHSKGVLAWDDTGNGLIMQVTTPSWPGSGSEDFPRKLGNTLGCVHDPNNLNNAQHFFSLKLNKNGVKAVLEGLANAGVATDWHTPQLARLRAPEDIVKLAKMVGVKPDPKKKTPATMRILQVRLADDVTMISKPSNLNVPPWQMVSALLDSEPERTATWWASPRIPSTDESTRIGCWEGELVTEHKKPGRVDIAKSGHWETHEFGLIGGQSHAKVGVTTAGSKHYTIFGDLNQQGTLNPVAKVKCAKSQNARGGLFFVVENEGLFKTVSDLIKGDVAAVGAIK